MFTLYIEQDLANPVRKPTNAFVYIFYVYLENEILYKYSDVLSEYSYSRAIF